MARSKTPSPARGPQHKSPSPPPRKANSPPEESRRRETNGEGRPRRKDAGFRWKDSRRDDNRDSRDRRDPRDSRDDRRLERGYRGRDRSRSPGRDTKREEKTTPKATKAAPPAAGSGEPMIIVNVNDRLGTKAAIPCLASDPVGLFKAQVAARIGRQPHEILLKRQGERPFKDVLTLEDYGVSNGVQLDLELNAGD